MGCSRESATFQTSLDDTASVVRARQSFSVWLDGLGVVGEFCDEMAVVFSELAANASDASAGTGERPAVRAWTEHGSVLLEVTNPVREGEVGWNVDVGDPLRHGGRGLMIARAYTDDLHLDVVGDRIRIRCRRRYA